MTARFATPVLILGLLLVAYSLGGTAPFGRLALSLGLPGLAVPMLETPEWRGYALYRSGDFEASAKAFTDAGAESSYNLGNAQAKAGEYAAAMEAYDIALAQNPDDAEARANFELVKSFYAGTELDPGSFLPTEEKDSDVTAKAETGQGQARAQGTGSQANNFGTNPAIPLILSDEQQQVSRVFDAQFVEATDRWLATLEDEPGLYLAARIAEEHKARVSAGTAMPEAESPW
jgi:Ca-activated chloride channel homolog